MIQDEILAIMDVAVIEKEIKSREYLLSIMVGNLYPSIIHDELDQLHERLRQLCTSNLTPEPSV
jgi:hypothetical protein